MYNNMRRRFAILLCCVYGWTLLFFISLVKRHTPPQPSSPKGLALLPAHMRAKAFHVRKQQYICMHVLLLYL